MAYDVVVAGGGRIGSTTAIFLSDMGFNVLVIEDNPSRIRVLRERYGLDVFKANIFSNSVDDMLRSSNVVALALPGSIGFSGLEKTLRLGVKNIVDVSYMAEDPLVLNDTARNKGSIAIVDAGLAPGLSNLFVGHSYSMLNIVEDVLIYVGGLSKDPRCPLGLAATWNIRDLLEEYIRPARIIINGEIKAVDPLEYSGRISIPGKGSYEYFASDGLRTMLKSLKPPRNTMAEFTLRYPGHIEKMKTLRELGFLSSIGLRIGKCEYDILEFTAQVLGLKLSECSKDRVLMYINISGIDKDGKPCIHELVLDEYYDDSRNITAMSKTTSGVQACTVKLLIENREELDKGVYGLEIVGLKDKTYKYMVECIRDLGINLYIWRKVLEN